MCFKYRTGRRVLSREDRRRERERRDLEMNRNIPQINAFVHNFSEREYDLDQKQPVASDLPADRDDRPTHIDGTVLPDGRFVPKPIHAKAAPAPPPYPSRVGHSSPAERRAQRLFNRLEDVRLFHSYFSRLILTKPFVLFLLTRWVLALPPILV